MESTAQFLAGNFGQLLSEEYQLLSGVGGEATELRDDLATMNALLRMQSEADEGAVDHFVREWMKQLRELAYDSEDCVDLYRLRIKPRPSDGVRAWLERLLGTLLPRRRLACEIRALRARATAIGERHARYYGVNRDALRGSAASFAPPVLVASALSAQALHRADDPEKQGIEEQAVALAERIKASVDERNPKVFLIVGSKHDDRTRLAVEVCRRLEAEFPFQARVDVPHAFEPSKDLEALLRHVFEQVAKPKPKPDDGEAVNKDGDLRDMDSCLDAEHLAKKRENITDKRYLILINDVRTTAAWDGIRSKLPKKNQSTIIRIIVTTLTETVTKQCISPDSVNLHYIYRMRPLRLQNDRHQFVGVKDQVISLAEKLKLNEVDGGPMRVFSIVGFGGVGKTTLAMEVCRQLEVDFPFQAMVSVSQAFEPTRDLKPLLKRVLHQLVTKRRAENQKGINEEGHLDLHNIDGQDADQLATKLKESLKDNRYLVVIDDVWTIRAWEAIQSVLPENDCNSRIIVTTRIDTVAKVCSPAGDSGNYIHRMKALKLEDSKKLFLRRAFGSMDAEYPEELEDVIGNILKKCGGMPLAIVSIANVLAGYTSSGSKEKWETICKSIGSQMEMHPTLEGMRHIVTLSYNHMPYELKSCMMYLSVFPEDYEINKDWLLARWIAEGLVPEKRGLTLMEVAESYLDELVSRNMVEPRFGVDGKGSCRVHDMFLEVMVSMSLECNFVSLVGGQYAGMCYDRIRRLSIHGDDRRAIGAKKHKKKNKKVGHGIEGMDVEHVRSLSMFQLEGKNSTRLLHHLLHKFTLLRVLDLEDCEGLTDDHMRYICRLYLLKFLSLMSTKISQVPVQVGELEHLQTFDVRHTNLKGLPETMIKLEKLERLDFNSKIAWYYKWRLPRGLKNMKALRRVDASILKDDVQVAQELGELQQLEDLYLCVECHDDKVVEELAKSLSKIHSLRRFGVTGMHGGALAFLYNLPTPPRLLRYLHIEGQLVHGIPLWVGSLTHLVKFNIMHVGFHGDQLFGVLCKLPNLKSISMMNGCYADEKIVAKTSHNFPVLSHLDVICNYGSSLPKHFVFEAGSMAKLKTLNMFFSDVERTIDGLEHLTSLKEVELTGKKGNPSLNRVLGQLKDENTRNRHESNQIQVVVKYE